MLRLARQGYGGGNPEHILGMRADIVLMALQYEYFLNDFENASYEIAKQRES